MTEHRAAPADSPHGCEDLQSKWAWNWIKNIENLWKIWTHTGIFNNPDVGHPLKRMVSFYHDDAFLPFLNNLFLWVATCCLYLCSVWRYMFRKSDNFRVRNERGHCSLPLRDSSLFWLLKGDKEWVRRVTVTLHTHSFPDLKIASYQRSNYLNIPFLFYMHRINYFYAYKNKCIYF